MLLRDLTIENYRSFDKYRLDNLARVNLLVGDNNCGKTSVLEAVHLLVCGGDVAELYQYLERRGEFTPLPPIVNDRPRNLYHVRSLFHGLDESDRLNLSGLEFRLISTLVDGRELKLDGSIIDATDSVAAQLHFEGAGYPGERVSANAPLDEAGRIVGQRHIWMGGFVSGNRLNLPHPTTFIPPDGLAFKVLTRGWDTLQRGQREGDVISALQVVEERTSDIRFGSEAQTRHDILLNLGSRRVPLSTLGDGCYVALSLAIAIANVRGGALLVDEIDTGLHYSRLLDMWRMVIQSAKDLDVQVFATTHSLDCIRGLAAAVRDDESFSDEVAIFRIDRRTDTAVRFDGGELQTVVNHEIEVR